MAKKVFKKAAKKPDPRKSITTKDHIADLRRQKEAIADELTRLTHREDDLVDDCVLECKKKFSKEIDLINSLRIFQHSFSIQVKMEVEIDCARQAFDDLFWGSVYVAAKEPKGYIVSMFMADDSIGNMGMEDESNFRCICPQVAKQISDLNKAEKDLAKKVKKIANKSSIDVNLVLDMLFHE